MVPFADWLPATTIYLLPTSQPHQPRPWEFGWVTEFLTPKQMKMKETQRRLLPSKAVVSLTSCREEILVLLNSYHIGPQTTIITGINRGILKGKGRNVKG